MSVGLSVSLDKKDLDRLLALPAKARFAGAVALTRTAKDAQKALQVQAASVFHLRNSWVPKGIRIQAATKSSMVATVGSVDKYMARHVYGEDKAAGKGLSISGRGANGRIASGGLLIPIYNSIGAAPTHTAERRLLARIDGQKKKTFQIESHGQVLIVRRTGKKRSPLQVLAVLRNKAHDQRRWTIEQTVRGVVNARFGEHLEAALLQYQK